MKSILMTSLLLAAILMPQDLSFTLQPSLSEDNLHRWWAEFGLNRAADVEVCIVDMADSAIVRRLAAGVLGPNAPEPLVKDSLNQRIEWDGRDDLGNTANAAGSYSIRVRAGMSAALDRLAGGNPYGFRNPGRGYSRINGLAAGADGSLFVYGSSGDLGQLSLRQYDASGSYIKTLFPYPANLPLSEISGFGVNRWPDGKFSPKGDWNSGTFSPSFSTSPVTVSGSRLLSLGLGNELAVGKFEVMMVRTTGAFGGSGASFPLVTSPAYQPDTYYGGGPFYAAASRNPAVIYLSGYYQCIQLWGSLTEAPDTGFWRDGCVYKVDRNTGAARQWISLDSVPRFPADRIPKIGEGPSFSAIHGLAEDHLGHVFVCDRFHGRVNVYDTSGALRGGINVDYPENVVVDTATGALFVLTRYESPSWHVGEIKLLKFAGWQAGDTPVVSRVLTTVLADYASEKPHMALARSSGGLIIWIGYLTIGVQGYRDDGSTLTLIKDFYAEHPVVTLGIDRLAVDRGSETVYFSDNWSRLFKIEDWADAAILPCSTSAGRPLSGVDFSVSFDRRLYVRENPNAGASSGGWYGPVSRFTLDHYHAPLPYANTGANQILPVTERAGEGLPGRGIAPSPDGRIHFVTESSFGNQVVGSCADTGAVFEGNTPFLMPVDFDTLAYPVNASYCGGIKADLRGNVYLGSNIRPLDHVVPSGFEADFAYGYGIGAIVKFAPGARGSITGTTQNPVVQGALKVYSVGNAPFFSHDGQTRCFCRSPQFDVDAYGRLFVPNAFTSKVAVTDNNGNLITQFGDYGNWDSQGAGSAVPAPGIPLGWPVAVGASENYIYVSDMLNSRLARVRMNFELNSLPGLPEAAVRAQAGFKPAPEMIAAPNPFSTATRIRIAGVSDLAIYDLAGKRVAAWKNVKREVIWNAGNLPACVYVLRMTTGQGTFSRKILKLK